MPQIIDSAGEIEIVVVSSRAAKFTMGERVSLVFRPIDAPNPPYTLRITSPSGKSIVDTIVRSLPTGEPQSAPPFEFSPSVLGVYTIELKESKGRAYGKGSLKID